MKKVTFLILVVIFSFCFCFCSENLYNPGSFVLSEYEDYILKFPYDADYEKTIESEDAIEIAKELWRKNYNEKLNSPGEIEIFYDEECEVWLVKGKILLNELGANVFGGVPYLLIQKDGKVIAMWHTK